MAENSLIQSVLNVFDLDKQSQRALLEKIDQMIAIAERARVAMDETSKTIVYSEFRVSQDIIAIKAIEESLTKVGIPAEEYVPFNRMQLHELLQHISTISHKAATDISQLVE